MAYTPSCMHACMHIALLQALSILLLASMLVPGPGSAEEAPSGYRIELIHVDANGDFTREELISRAVDRAHLRVAMLSATDGTKLKAHYTESAAEYLMELKIGKQSEPFWAVVDTGSELVWTKLCNRGSSSTFTYVKCSDDICPEIPDGPSNCKSCPVSAKCDHGQCKFEKKYGSGLKSAKGFMANETLTLSGETTDKTIAFGCATDIDDGLMPKSADGIVGLNRGPLSLWKQMGVTNFSYCLSNQHTPEKSSPLWIGLPLADSVAAEMKSTPLVQLSSNGDRYRDKYHVELFAISIGGVKRELEQKLFRFKSEKGEGAMMVDSGCWRTSLEKPVFVELKMLLSETKLKGPHSITEKGMVFNACFKPDTEMPDNKPPLKLHFKPDAEMLIPWDNYMYPVRSEFCLAINETEGISILGNFLQQNIHMHYDLTETKEKLSFKRVDDCSRQL